MEFSLRFSIERTSENAAAFTARLRASHSAIQLFTVFAVSRSLCRAVLSTWLGEGLLVLPSSPRFMILILVCIVVSSLLVFFCWATNLFGLNPFWWHRFVSTLHVFDQLLSNCLAIPEVGHRSLLNSSSIRKIRGCILTETT